MKLERGIERETGGEGEENVSRAERKREESWKVEEEVREDGLSRARDRNERKAAEGRRDRVVESRPG